MRSYEEVRADVDKFVDELRFLEPEFEFNIKVSQGEIRVLRTMARQRVGMIALRTKFDPTTHPDYVAPTPPPEDDKPLPTRSEAIRQAEALRDQLAAADGTVDFTVESTNCNTVVVYRNAKRYAQMLPSAVVTIRCRPDVKAPPAGTPVVWCDDYGRGATIGTSKGYFVSGDVLKAHDFSGLTYTTKNWHSPTLGTYSSAWTDACNTPGTQRLARIILGQPVD